SPPRSRANSFGWRRLWVRLRFDSWTISYASGRVLHRGRIDTLDRWIFPRARDAVVAARHTLERFLEHLREEQQRGTDSGSARERPGEGKRRAQLARHDRRLVVIARSVARTPSVADLRGSASQQQIRRVSIALA